MEPRAVGPCRRSRRSRVADLLSHLTILFGLIPGHTASSGLPDWSLSLEMQFHAVFPRVYLAARR